MKSKFTSGLLAKALSLASTDKNLRIDYGQEFSSERKEPLIMDEYEDTLMKLYMMTVGHPTNTNRAPPRKKSAGTYVGCTKRTIFSRLIMHNKTNGAVINKKTKKSASRWCLAMIIFVPHSFHDTFYNVAVKNDDDGNSDGDSDSDEESSSSSDSGSEGVDSKKKKKYVRLCLTKIIRNYWKRAHGINGKFRRGLEIVNMFSGLKYYATKESILYMESMR